MHRLLSNHRTQSFNLRIPFRLTEDIDAILDQDPQRVCVLQGPIAVKHSPVKDVPIKDLLGTLLLVDKLVDRP